MYPEDEFDLDLDTPDPVPPPKPPESDETGAYAPNSLNPHVKIPKPPADD